MDNLLLSFNVVAPLTIYMLVGWLLRRSGLLGEDFFTKLSQLVFYVCVPALCLDNLRELDFSEVLANPTALYMAAAVLVVFSLTFLIVPRFCHEPSRCGVMTHAIFRSNDGVFGLAVAETLLGAANMGLMVVCVAITIPIYNLLAVVVMEYYRGGKPSIGRMLVKVVTNPIIIGCVLGALLAILGLGLPAFIAKPLAGLSGACAPLGFVALGGALSFASLSKNRLALSIVCLFKLIVIPVCTLSAFYLLGMRGVGLLVGMVIFGAPCAMSVYPMSCTMGGDEQLAGGAVALTSVLSLVTIFLFIFFFKQWGVA